MAIVFDIDHEGSTPWGYNAGIVTNGGDWSVGAAGALAGSGAGNINVCNDTVSQYGVAMLGSPNTSGIASMRAYLDPNGLTGGSEAQAILLSNSSGDSFTGMQFMYSAGNLYMRTLLGRDAGGSDHRDVIISDAPHYVEVRAYRATGPSTGDGYLRTWIDGVEQTVLTGVDNYSRFANMLYLTVGKSFATGTWSGGPYYVDEIIVRDDDTYIGPVAGGSEYQQSIAGAVGPAGGLLKQIYKGIGGGLGLAGALASIKSILVALVGAVGPSGVLAKAAAFARSVAGAFSPAGQITRLILRILGGGITPAGALQSAKAILAELVGVVSTAGAITRQVGRSLAGAIEPVGGLTRQVRAILSGELTAAGLLSGLKSLVIDLSGSLSPSGLLASARAVLVSLAGAMAPEGVISRAVAFVLATAGAVSPAGVISRAVAFVRSFGGFVAPAGLLGSIKARLVELAGLVAPAGALGRVMAYFRAAAGAVTPEGAVSRTAAYLRNLAGAVGPVGAVSRAVAFLRSLGGSVDLVGVVHRAAVVALGGVMSASGQLVRLLTISVNGAVTLSGAVVRSISKTLAGAVGFIGGLISRLSEFGIPGRAVAAIRAAASAIGSTKSPLPGGESSTQRATGGDRASGTAAGEDSYG